MTLRYLLLEDGKTMDSLLGHIYNIGTVFRI